MVCKAEVLLWFQNLESYNRVDILYELLNMCIPFELRFLGTCIEEIGKYTYQELRGPAIIANDLEKLSKDTPITQSLLDENVRHRVLISISLLSSRNYSIANWLYKNVLKTDWVEGCIVKGNIKDENVQNEFLLLFVMALHHPAFTFEQKCYFNYILTQLVELKESKARISPKPSGYTYPPGFGYPTNKIMNTQEVPIASVKPSIAIPCGDDILHQAPPCLPPLQSNQEWPWGIPGFPCGAPEVVPPFRLPTSSTLVSESTSPSHSRSNSPHRIVTMPQHQSGRLVDTGPSQLPLDALSSGFTFLQPSDNVKMENEELGAIHEEKLLDSGWPTIKEVKHQNGLRYPDYPNHQPKPSRPLVFFEQFQALSLDGAGDNNNTTNTNSLHRSNSSSTSSLNHTPPDTPSVPKHPQRVNGLPFNLCDTTSPPPQTGFSTVPFTTYSPYGRTVFAPYSQSYRPPFAPHFPAYATNENAFSNYPVPMVPIMLPPGTFPPRSANCYNCGGVGHPGGECGGQGIEDITQKASYTIEFGPPSDGDGK